MRLEQLIALFSRGNIPFDKIYSVGYFLKNYEILINKTSTNFIVLNINRHWLGLIVYPNYSLIYIDSLGGNLLAYDPAFECLLSEYRLIGCLEQRLQSEHSNTCGFYLFYFFKKIKQGKSLGSILTPFSKNLIQNDIYITHWIQPWIA